MYKKGTIQNETVIVTVIVGPFSFLKEKRRLKHKLIVLVAVNEAVRKIEIHSVAGSQQFNGNFTTMRFSQEHVPANTIDGNLQSDPFYCFVAGSHIDSWLVFHMQWSMVTHVKLMNVGTG